MKATTKLRELLGGDGIVAAPGAYDCLTARIIEREDFPAVYMTGAGTSLSRIGYPDLGLATASEMLANAGAIAASVGVPVIADADTGYGDVLNVQRTVRQYEQAGIAAMHIEDQAFPKRCGHLDDKQVAPAADMVRKIRAAVDARTDDDFVIIARTDALAVTGWDDTMRRAEAYVRAGADMLFVEAIRTPEQAEALPGMFGVPLVYNYVETGKSPLLPVDELSRLGYKLVIYPASALLTVTRAVTDVVRALRTEGGTAHLVDDHMVSLVECFEVAGLTHMLATDARFAGAEA
jgi:2-methylisocitrate lyase-like PEP mutase family enzyme